MNWLAGWLSRYAATPVDRPAVSAADIVPGFAPADVVDVALDDTPAAVELEQSARLTHAARIVHRTLLAESLKDPALRNVALMDLCLELRTALKPPTGSEVLREVPPVGVRHAVPVVPGRTS